MKFSLPKYTKKYIVCVEKHPTFIASFFIDETVTNSIHGLNFLFSSFPKFSWQSNGVVAYLIFLIDPFLFSLLLL